MKADVLCGFDEVKINNSYTFEDSIISHLPIESIADVIANNDIVLPGWNNCRDDKNLALFLSRIQENIPVPISGISIGPNREDYIALR
jgi:adenylosuccinate synthase